MSATVRSHCLLILLACLCCDAFAVEVGQQAVVTVDVATLHAGTEEVGNLPRGTTLTVLEASDGWLRIETNISAWIAEADVATADQLRKTVDQQTNAGELIDAIDTVSQLLKLDKDRRWQDHRTRAELIPQIVLQEEHLTEDKLPIAIDGMAIVISDWQDAKELGANAGLARTETIKVHLVRADLRARLATVNGGEFETPLLCQLIRGQAEVGDRDIEAASEQVQSAIEEYLEIDRLVEEHDGILTSRDIRERGHRLARLYHQLGDCLLVAKKFDEADKAYNTAINTIDSRKIFGDLEDTYGRCLFGRALIRQLQGEEAVEQFAEAVEVASFGTPGLDKELKHWANVDAKPLPPNIAVGPDGEPLTTVEEVIAMVAEKKGLKPEQIKASSKLADLKLNERDLFDIVEQYEERHRVVVSLKDIEGVTGDLFGDSGPLRGTIATLVIMFERAEKP